MKSYPPVNAKAPFIWHGGDYNPEQWPREVWQEDFRLMREAGITVATVGVFSWVTLQPAEDTFNFGWLDEVLDGLHENGIKAILATPSAAQPAWMSQAYPEIMRVNEHGQRLVHSGRVNYCPNSPDYRRFSGDMARRLAERYGQHPAVILWHISNEYDGWCYCDTCAANFREWLKAKYGAIDELNQRYWTAFWSHTYTDWSQIMPPYQHGERLTHGLTLDYFRFMTESNIACYTHERDIIRGITPDIPITTNLMGTYKPFDYRKWAKEMDVITWDCYPQPNQSPGEIAFMHDIMRGLKDGQPFLLMEQTPSSQNWQAVNALKRPGVLRLWSYLALAHGADSVLYFQWRRGRGGSEKLHGAVVEHAGRSDTRVFREVSQLGAELKTLGDNFLGATTQSRVGIVFDWDNWHALDNAIGPVRDKRYYQTVAKHYESFYRQHVPVDVLYADSDLSQYDIVIAPMMYMVKSDFAEQVKQFVAQGGTFVSTYFSGIVDETDLAFENGYPGPLADVLGIWVEEIDALYTGESNSIVMDDGSGTFTCDHLADLLHTEGADVLATYGRDFYEGMPVLTKNQYGAGAAYYIASNPEDAFLDAFYGRVLVEKGIQPAGEAPAGVEIAVRQKVGQSFIFVLNHNAHAVDVNLGEGAFHDLLRNGRASGSFTIAPYDVRVLMSETS
ncbi:MAG: beta-galactosidase [Anaerolineaceae bacterium]|nr:beta-galactosidase [Anaerolineaceae bacterium]